MSDTSSTASDVQYLSPRDAAELLHLPSVTARTLRAWAKQGKLPVLTLPSGRMLFRREDVEALATPQVLSVPSAGSPAESPDGVLPGQPVLSWPSPSSPAAAGGASS